MNKIILQEFKKYGKPRVFEINNCIENQFLLA